MSKEDNRLAELLFDGALFVAVVGTFLFVAHYGMSLFYPSPAYEDFCGEPRIEAPTENLTESQCEDIGGRWHSYNEPRPLPAAGQTRTASPTTTGTTTVSGYCERDYECRQAFSEAQNKHGRTAFAILATLGIIVAAFGFRREDRGVLGVSLAAGGALLVFISTVRFWNEASDYLQFALLLVALGVFIYFGYKRDRGR